MKRDAYATLHGQLASLLEECPDTVSALSTTVALLHTSFDHFFWTGFYLAARDGSGDLVIGPYQGPLACQRIERGRGVCGAAAERRETILVPDVHAFPGHIACSSESKSEIVIPLIAGGEVLGVLDVDSDQAGAFDGMDCEGREEAMRLLRASGNLVSE